jgi:tRNA threonylcarbamoyladenosine biosynthesis protein TsaE
LLKSDIGGGKTTFVKGLAKGLGSTDQVGSPTYTINRVYKCANGLELQHFDFYRLQDAGIVAHELAEFIGEPNTIIAIEWGDIVTNTLPQERIEITIERLATSEEARHISINSPQAFSYLIKDTK